MSLDLSFNFGLDESTAFSRYVVLLVAACIGCGGTPGSSSNSVPTLTIPQKSQQSSPQETRWIGIESGYSGSTVRHPDGHVINSTTNAGDPGDGK